MEVVEKALEMNQPYPPLGTWTSKDHRLHWGVFGKGPLAQSGPGETRPRTAGAGFWKAHEFRPNERRGWMVRRGSSALRERSSGVCLATTWLFGDLVGHDGISSRQREPSHWTLL